MPICNQAGKRNVTCLFLLSLLCLLLVAGFSKEAISKPDPEVEQIAEIGKFIEPTTTIPKMPTGEYTKPKKVKLPPKKKSMGVKEIARRESAEIFGSSQWSALKSLWGKESGWDVGRVNPSSYACGIPQALPCSKIYGYTPKSQWIGGKLYLVGADAEKEVVWGLNYIKERYGNPTNALAFHRRHNWY